MEPGLVAIFDGHGGHEIAERAAFLLDSILTNVYLKKFHPELVEVKTNIDYEVATTRLDESDNDDPDFSKRDSGNLDEVHSGKVDDAKSIQALIDQKKRAASTLSLGAPPSKCATIRTKSM